jgi:O-palmitoleoyl-L-serine hydrolase
MQTIKVMAENLFNLIQDEGTGFPFPDCLKEYNNEYYHCYNAANLAKYQKAPMFIIESPYDQYSIDNIVVALCKTNKNPPFNLDTCNESAIAAIEDYRSLTIKAIEQIKGSRKDVGAWVPSCVQHGFTDMNSFTDPRFRIPSVNAPMVSVAIAEFLSNPQ